MTERLYYRDAQVLTFDANVIACAGDATHILLDRSAFYPTSGGQPHDTGRLGGVRVINVIDTDAGVVHVVEMPVPLGPVHGEVDRARREDLTIQHSGQHLLSALAADRFGWETTSVHFGDEASTIEFAVASTPPERLTELEDAANAAIGSALELSVSFEEAAAATRAGLRKPTDRSGLVRVVTIDGVDRSACGGTHVRRTSELGMIMVGGTERIRGNVRLNFIAGARILRRLRSVQETLDTLAAAAVCAPDGLTALIPARLAELKDLRARMADAEEQLALMRLRELQSLSAADADGLHRVVHRASSESAAMLRQMAQAVSSMRRLLFITLDENARTVYVGASADTGIDAGARLKAALAAVGGRGGGSPRLAQGTVPTNEALEALVVALSPPG